MEPPFPGMNPYLEASHRWPDVHNRLAVAICDQLQPLLSPRYFAELVPYVALEDVVLSSSRSIVPDVAIRERETLESVRGAVMIAPAPLTALVAMEIETRYTHIEIRTISEETLVTAIEILSPVNKRPGAEAADTYDRKRREIFNSAVHLLEIDLLRAGRRPAVATPLPEAPYFVFLSRVQRRPRIEIWPLGLRDAIPTLPVPLQQGDADVPLRLTDALRHIYASARYDLRIDYREPPPAPDLPAEDAAWLDAHLRELGLRP